MKIQCGFCGKEEASVFCSADEGPLCDVCDRQIHHTNNLARKHKRFSLLRPSLKGCPSCDICQEKRAFLFCKEDRAILCRECDASVHKTNEHTWKHCRLLLTGVTLSASASEYPISTQSSSRFTLDSDAEPSKSSTKRPAAVSASQLCSTATTTATCAHTKPSRTPAKRPTSVSAALSNPAALASYKSDHDNQSISQYLMETLPGWRVDDFLDPCAGFSEFPDPDSSGIHPSSFPYEDFSVWVPQDTPLFNHLPLFVPQTGMGNRLSKASGYEEASAMKASRQRIDDGFTVPEISTLPLKNYEIYDA